FHRLELPHSFAPNRFQNALLSCKQATKRQGYPGQTPRAAPTKGRRLRCASVYAYIGRPGENKGYVRLGGLCRPQYMSYSAARRRRGAKFRKFAACRIAKKPVD